MITASHNPKDDNGVKIIEEGGEVMDTAWEPLAEEIVNAPDLVAFLKNFDANTAEKVKYGFPETMSIFDHVSEDDIMVFGHDTRETSPMLVEAASKAAEIMGLKTINHGLVTTPQLHWLVAQNLIKEGEADIYYEHFAGKYLDFMKLCDADGSKKNYERFLTLDCANGVGSMAMKKIMKQPGFADRLKIYMINDFKQPALLNDECGAGHVQQYRVLPNGWTVNDHSYTKCVSFDGDADRQIYYYGDDKYQIKMIDGDKQFAFIMMYIKTLLKKLELDDDVSYILVQNAYCNSRVQKYLKENGIKQQLVKTGVKHAHPVIVNYDIGANDEPNGHGTVAYKEDRIAEVLENNDSVEAKKLRGILEISNILVGDAIANLLVQEAILYDLDMSIKDYFHIYEENPSKNYKIKVNDRHVFKMIDDESRLTQPIEVQEDIDKLLETVEEGKAFVRPSGTEDILRLYAEAKTEEQMDQLGEGICALFDDKYSDL